jgi:xanthine/CO dehydrogenase XdhC/CoxF family maturation factor
MDHRTAGLMLYALQTASVNLRNAQFEASEATHVVIDRDDVYRTSIGGPQWFEQDFEDESEEDDEAQSDDGVPDDDEDDDEGDEGDAAAGEVQVIAEAVNETEAVKHITVEEARMKVQGVVRNWLLETMGEKAAAKPD